MSFNYGDLDKLIDFKEEEEEKAFNYEDLDSAIGFNAADYVKKNYGELAPTQEPYTPAQITQQKPEFMSIEEPRYQYDKRQQQDIPMPQYNENMQIGPAPVEPIPPKKRSSNGMTEQEFVDIVKGVSKPLPEGSPDLKTAFDPVAQPREKLSEYIADAQKISSPDRPGESFTDIAKENMKSFENGMEAINTKFNTGIKTVRDYVEKRHEEEKQIAKEFKDKTGIDYNVFPFTEGIVDNLLRMEKDSSFVPRNFGQKVAYSAGRLFETAGELGVMIPKTGLFGALYIFNLINTATSQQSLNTKLKQATIGNLPEKTLDLINLYNDKKISYSALKDIAKKTNVGDIAGAGVQTLIWKSITTLVPWAWTKGKGYYELTPTQVQNIIDGQVISSGQKNIILDMFPNARNEGIKLTSTEYRKWIQPLRKIFTTEAGKFKAYGKGNEVTDIVINYPEYSARLSGGLTDISKGAIDVRGELAGRPNVAGAIEPPIATGAGKQAIRMPGTPKPTEPIAGYQTRFDGAIPQPGHIQEQIQGKVPLGPDRQIQAPDTGVIPAPGHVPTKPIELPGGEKQYLLTPAGKEHLYGKAIEQLLAEREQALAIQDYAGLLKINDKMESIHQKLIKLYKGEPVKKDVEKADVPSVQTATEPDLKDSVPVKEISDPVISRKDQDIYKELDQHIKKSKVKPIDNKDIIKEINNSMQYHGSNEIRDTLKITDTNTTNPGNAGTGIHVTPAKAIARSYGTKVDERKVKINNPLIIKRVGTIQDYRDNIDKVGKDIGVEATSEWSGTKQISREYADEFREKALADGYDSAVTIGDKGIIEAVLYNPEVQVIKESLITDAAEVQKIKNGIAEGEMILKSGKTAAGRKMSEGELETVQRSVNNSKSKIGQEITEPKPYTDQEYWGKQIASIVKDPRNITKDEWKELTPIYDELIKDVDSRDYWEPALGVAKKIATERGDIIVGAGEGKVKDEPRITEKGQKKAAEGTIDNPRYKAYLNATDKPTNYGYMGFISDMRQKFNKEFDIKNDGLTDSQQKDFTKFIVDLAKPVEADGLINVYATKTAGRVGGGYSIISGQKPKLDTGQSIELLGKYSPNAIKSIDKYIGMESISELKTRLSKAADNEPLTTIKTSNTRPQEKDIAKMSKEDYLSDTTFRSFPGEMIRFKIPVAGKMEIVEDLPVKIMEDGIAQVEYFGAKYIVPKFWEAVPDRGTRLSQYKTAIKRYPAVVSQKGKVVPTIKPIPPERLHAQIVKKKQTVAVLKMVHVKDGIMQSTDLETNIVTKTDLADGIYELVNKNYIKRDDFDIDDYPEPMDEAFKGTPDDYNIVVNDKQLKELGKYASTDSEKVILNGIHINIINGNVFLESADGYRMMRRYAGKSEGAGDQSFILNKDAAKILASYKGDQAIKMSVFEEGFIIDNGDMKLNSRRIRGIYPDIDMLVPKETTKKMSFSKPEMLKALEEIKPYLTAKIIRLEQVEDGIEVHSYHEERGEKSIIVNGSMVEESNTVNPNDELQLFMPIKITKDPKGEKIPDEILTKRIYLNNDILKDVINNHPKDAVDVLYLNPERPFVVVDSETGVSGAIKKKSKEIVSSSSLSGSAPNLSGSQPKLFGLKQEGEKPIKGGGYGKVEYNEKALRTEDVPQQKDYSNIEIKKDEVNYIKEYLKVLAPAQISTETKIAAGLLRENMGKLAQLDSAVKKSFQKARKELHKLSNADVVTFIDNIENGTPQEHPILQPIADAFRKLLDDRRDKVIALGKGQLSNYIDNYFPHIWEDPTRAKKVIATIMGKRRIVGSKSFLKERKIDLFKEGVEYGLEPVSWNPVDIVMLRAHEMDKYVLAQELIGELKARDLVKFVYSRSKTPDGYKRINDNAFTVFMPPEMTVNEAYDKVLVEQMMSVAESLGIDTQRLMKLKGGSLGLAYGRYGETGGERVRTKFASPESVLAHEIGHVLGYRYKLYDTILRTGEGKMRTVMSGKKAGKQVFKPEKEAVEWRRVVAKEWRDLADARFATMSPSNTFKSYVRKAREKEAVLLESLIHAPDMFKEIAPTLYKEFTSILAKHSVLRPLLDTKPSVVLGSGSAKIPVPGFTTIGFFSAKEDIADLINNHLSPGLRAAPNRIVRDGYNAIRGVGNLLNQVQLSLSAFHGLNVTTDMIASSIGLGARRLTTDQQKLLGIVNIIAAPFAPIKYTWEGARLRKAYNQSIESIKDPKMRAMVEAVVKAGGRDKMDTFYYNNAIEHLSTTFRDITRSGDFKKMATGVMKLPIDLLGATFEALAKPLMEWYVPAGKLGVFSDMAKHELKRYESGEIDSDQLMFRLMAAWDSVDNRMGQLIYDNLFWNKYIKDVAMLSMRSVGWTLGSIRETAGAFTDIVGTKTRLDEGDKLFSIRQSQVVGWVATYAVLGAVLTYLMTGKKPDEPKDYFFPKTGQTNPDGSEQRLSLPTYAKDWYAWRERPLHTAKAKLHPIWGLGMDLAKNKDFFSVQIRDPKDPLEKQMFDVGKYVYETALPLSIKNYKKMSKSSGSLGNVYVSITGITSAPSYINRTVAQKLMYRYVIEKIPDVTKTREDFERSQYRSNFINKLRRGDPVDRQEARKLLGSRSYMSAVKTSKISSFADSFKRLTLEQGLDVYAISTKKEKAEAKSVLFKKFKNAYDANKITPELREYYNELTK